MRLCSKFWTINLNLCIVLKIEVDEIKRLEFQVAFSDDYFVTLISDNLELGRLQEYLVTVNQKHVPPQLPLATNKEFWITVESSLLGCIEPYALL
jgi:hypothetical protein